MFKKMSVCRLMISCPSDVRNEIEIINRVVGNINDSIGVSMDVYIKTLYYKKNTIPESGDYPQSIVNKQILEKADALVAVMRNRVGSPTRHHESGTIEEIELMLQKGKQVFVYFSNNLIMRNEIDLEEEKKIRVFKDKYKSRGIYVEYNSDEEFYEIINSHLTQYIIAELSSETKYIEEHTRFDDAINRREEVDLIYDYTKFYEIRSVNSGVLPNVIKIETHKHCFDINIEICNVAEMRNQEFVMAMFEYIPCDNWAGFFESGYFLEFDAICSGDIKAFQLEIKDNIRNKIIDKMVAVSNIGEHVSIWLPSTTRDLASWRKISQVCFTIFLNNGYIEGKQGVLRIENLKMIPK